MACTIATYDGSGIAVLHAVARGYQVPGLRGSANGRVAGSRKAVHFIDLPLFAEKRQNQHALQYFGIDGYAAAM